MSDWRVKVAFKDKAADTDELFTVVEKEYEFIDYTEMLSRELNRVLKKVEDAFFAFQNYKPKDEWDKETSERFNEIRHKLLDQANAIKRLPNNLTYQNIKANTMPLSEFIARTLK